MAYGVAVWSFSPPLGEVTTTVSDPVPACVTEKVCPPIVSVALRGSVPGFAATEYETLVLPVPFVADVIVSHDGAELVAVQPQLGADAVSATEPVPPAALNDWLVGSNE